jgi:hypothetical protein
MLAGTVRSHPFRPYLSTFLRLIAAAFAAAIFTPEASGQGAIEPVSSANNTPAGPRRFNPEKVHDPSTIITTDGIRRFFSTGAGVLLFREDAAGKWVREGRIFLKKEFPA